jgi:hypothetical protein
MFRQWFKLSIIIDANHHLTTKPNPDVFFEICDGMLGIQKSNDRRPNGPRNSPFGHLFRTNFCAVGGAVNGSQSGGLTGCTPSK